MFRVSLKGIWAHKRRLLRTCSAVLLGVAFLAGTLILGDTMRAGFSEVFADVYAKTDVVVQGTDTIGNNSEQRMIVPEDVLAKVKALADVKVAVADVSGSAQMIGSDGEPIGGQGPPTLGGTWLADNPTNPYHLAEGRLPRSDNEVVINALTATQGKLKIGDSTIVRTPTPVTVEIVGIAKFGDKDTIGGEGFVGFTPEAARKYLLGGKPGYSSISVLAADGIAPEHLAEEIQDLLPDGISANTAAEMRTQSEEAIGDAFLDGFEIILLVFTGVALLVATFSIYNTFSVILAQRTRESALFRAIGATRSQVLSSIGFEALAVGVVASLGGLLVGYGLAEGLTAAMRGFGVDLPGGLEVTTNTVVVSVIVGLAVTLLASLAPAIRASRVRPMEALRESAIDHSDASRVRAVLGIVLAALGLGLVLFGALGSPDSPFALTGPGAALLVIGMVVLGPVAARPVSFILGSPIAAARGSSGELAVGNAARNPSRTAGTAAALMIGVAVVVLFTVLGSSLTVMIRDTLTGSVEADLMLVESGFTGSGMSPELSSKLESLPQVKTSVGLGVGSVFVDGEATDVLVGDAPKIASTMDADVSLGSMADLGTTDIAVSREEADDNGWALGSAVNFGFIDGYKATMKVGAIFDRTELLGSIVLPRAIWSQHSTVDVDIMNLVRLQPGTDIESARRAVDDIAKEFGAPKAQTRAEYAEDAAGQVNQLLMIIYVLLALSIVIALMGIANTLSLSIHERTRELGLLRAIGQTRRQLRSMVRWESVIIAIYGTLGGVALGLFLGWGMVRSLSTEDLSGFSTPYTQLIVITIVGAAAGVLAAIMPARRAAKLDVLDAISME